MVTCFGSILLMMVQSRGCKMLQRRHSRNEVQSALSSIKTTGLDGTIVLYSSVCSAVYLCVLVCMHVLGDGNY